MPKQFLRRLLPQSMQALDRDGSLRFLISARFQEPNLWHLNRRSVSGGMAIGLFFAWIPMPFQMLAAAILALLARVNLPLAVIMVWVSNPLTWAPMYWFAYRLGKWLLGSEKVRASFEFHWTWFAEEMVRIWQPLLLGCFIMAVVSAVAGYVASRAIWRLHIVSNVLDRRRRGRDAAVPRERHRRR